VVDKVVGALKHQKKLKSRCLQLDFIAVNDIEGELASMSVFTP